MLRAVAHRIHQRRAIRKLHSLGMPRSILFVCYGNLYRSPYAAARFEQLIPPPFQGSIAVGSVGFARAGRPVPYAGITVAAAAGVDLSAHRSSTLDPGRVGGFDLIVAMEPRHAAAIRSRQTSSQPPIILLGDLDPCPGTPRTITDPANRDPEVLQEVYTRIDRCLEALINPILAAVNGR